MAEPFADKTKEAAAHELAQKQLVAAYQRIDPRVLADLHHRFQFNRWAAEDTEDERKIARRVFMHGPLFHIEKMRAMTFPKVKKPKQAKSTHEQQPEDSSGP